jgi:CDP-6-deoxy-D-xylo-4-hexulose-3-dehydrase
VKKAHPLRGFAKKKMAAWQASVEAEWLGRRKAEGPPKALFPLALNPFGVEEVLAMTEVLLSGKLTLGERVEAAERDFAARTGAPFAVMVNSGSSANLLAVAALVNKFRPVHLVPGDEVLVPAVCWSTSLHPLIQCGLTPVFVDVSPLTFNVGLEQLEAAVTPRTKALFAVHVLGNACCMTELLDFVARHNLALIEDTCESLGSYFVDAAGRRRMLGTAGDFGAYSFYFSHHITSGEGGMVTCQTEDDYNLLRCLRAHGWTRHLTNRDAVEAAHPDIDSRFLFVNLGFNLRPMEVQGAMLSVQLRKLEEYNAIRRSNLTRIHAALMAHPRFAGVMSMMQASIGVDPAWFGITLILHPAFGYQLSAYLAHLHARGVENRPVISGNFTRQPCVSAYCPVEDPSKYAGADAIHFRGFFIGVHQVVIGDETISQLVEVMMGFPFVHRAE